MSSIDVSQDFSGIPVFVDMDGTLVKSDIAQELLLQSFKNINQLKHIFTLCFSGRSHIKRFLAENNEFSASLLPYNQEIIDYLQQQKAAGRKIILATASDEIIAHKVAEHTGLFDDVIASTPGSNLKGENKLKAIKAYSSDKGFEYIGDSTADFPIWKDADKSGFVNPPKPANKIEKNTENISIEVNNKISTSKALIKAMRPHQWAKNALVFVPLIFSHSYTDASLLLLALITFFVFSFCASGIYIINDLLDIEADRMHTSKKKRPFAAGDLLPVKGVFVSFFLIAIPLLISAIFLGFFSTLVFVTYIILTNLYSFYLKHKSTIDVVTLTCLYTIRIIAGGVAIGASLSPWLLNFSLFFFLSLAYMKRYIELSGIKRNGKLNGRNYDVSEMDVILTTGIVNGGLAVLTLSMYLNSDFVTSSYASPQVLWLICPLLMFWVYRAWMWAKREKIDDDPVVFALKDRISLVTVALTGALVIISKFIHINTFI
ncbi:UbiA family prenyltransferase [Agarilytica rhodophyticola]|uniref:UbiA family prenyltransferase n=1 Tax=Agarilytica rhodophyticola TaxID=1737490 RepID=UPI000B344C74|nr:UbiA family prenyltransferase [Agarilytica rhodophyticola]